MEKCLDRMFVDHFWPGEPHDLLYFFPHLRRITMYGTFVTCRFCRAEMTFIDPGQRIGEYITTFYTKVLMVMILAIDPDHCLYGVYFSLY